MIFSSNTSFRKYSLLLKFAISFCKLEVLSAHLTLNVFLISEHLQICTIYNIYAYSRWISLLQIDIYTPPLIFYVIFSHHCYYWHSYHFSPLIIQKIYKVAYMDKELLNTCNCTHCTMYRYSNRVTMKINDSLLYAMTI